MKYFISLAITLLVSCSHLQETNKAVKINYADNKDIQQDDFIYTFIPLETTDDCLFGDIGAIKIVENKIYLIDGRSEKFLIFDITGKFITQVGQRGNGPGEYITPTAFHVDTVKRILTITDTNRGKLLHYNLDTYKYLSSKNTPYFTECAWLPDGNIAWLFTLGYKDKTTKDKYYIQITDADVNEVKLLYPASFTPDYLMTCGKSFYMQNNTCYINLTFSPVVYKVSSEKVSPVYEVDLGSPRFASMEWLQQHATRDYSAALIYSDYISTHNIKETDDWICLTYFLKKAVPFIGFYNKKDGSSYKLSAGEFMNISGLRGMGLIRGTYNNCFITLLFPESLKRRKTTIPALEPVLETIKEDDNPVLCLFTLKSK